MLWREDWEKTQLVLKWGWSTFKMVSFCIFDFFSIILILCYSRGLRVHDPVFPPKTQQHKPLKIRVIFSNDFFCHPPLGTLFPPTYNPIIRLVHNILLYDAEYLNKITPWTILSSDNKYTSRSCRIKTQMLTAVREWFLNAKHVQESYKVKKRVKSSSK